MWARIKALLFKNTTAKQTIAKNTIWNSVSNFGRRFIKAIVIIYAAHVLSTAGYGIFSYAMTLAAFLDVFIDPGLNSMLAEETSRIPEEERQRMSSTIFILKIILILVGVYVVIFIAPYFSTLPGAIKLLPIVALIMTFDSFREFFSAIMWSKERMEWEAYVFLIMNISIVVLGFIALTINPSAKSFGWAYAIGAGIGALASLITVRKYLKGILSNFSVRIIPKIFNSAWPFALSGALALLLTNTDIMIISWMRTASMWVYMLRPCV